MNASNAKDYLPLVQALAEGNVIQYKLRDGWSTGGDVDFSLPPDQYRIKPEPREIWVNRYADGTDGPLIYTSEEAARSCKSWKSGKPVKYREVIE